MKKNKRILILVTTFIILVACVVFVIFSKNTIDNITYIYKIRNIQADDYEIEKKWLIDKNQIPYDLSKAEIFKIEQTYICFSPEIRVRKINDGEQYTFTVKTNMTADGLTRDELEIDITQEEYENLINKKEGNTIYKTRYQFLDKGNILAIDIFSGELEGLAYLEIEFENKEQANSFETPDWVIKDVTSDINYKNGHLARFGIPNSFYIR